MTNSAQQIVTMYETLNLPIEQIAEIEKVPAVVVKSVLVANSPKYREDSSEKKAVDFTPEDADLALSVIRRVAQYSEDDSTALKAAMFIRNDKKGRLDVKKGLRNLNLNISVINDHIQKAIDAASAKVSPTKVIDV